MVEMDVLGRLERVEAQLAIQQLPARYALAVDTRNMDALVALFVDDVDCGTRGIGRQALRDRFVASTKHFYRSVHQIVGHSFEIVDADHAGGTVYCRAEHERGDRWIVAAMVYFDRYERRDGTWYFANRDFDFWYCADLLERPQEVDFQRWVIPDIRIEPQMIKPRFPSWSQFWSEQGDAAVSQLTSRP